VAIPVHKCRNIKKSITSGIAPHHFLLRRADWEKLYRTEGRSACLCRKLYATICCTIFVVTDGCQYFTFLCCWAHASVTL
jgi:hypothetical protein